MPIELSDLVKVLKLSEEQVTQMSGVQTAFDAALKDEIGTETTGLVNKNSDLIKRLKDAKEKVMPKDFDQDGYNDYVQNKDQILADKVKAEEDKLIAEQNWDKLKNQITNSHEQTLLELKNTSSSEITSLRSSLDNVIIENESIKAIEEANGSQVLLMPHISSNIETYKDETSGKYMTRVIDAAGKQRMNTENGEVFQIKDLITELQADERFAGAFPVLNKGSNTTVNIGTTNYTSANNPFDKKSKSHSITAQAQLRKANPVLAKTLKEAAEANG